MQKIRPDLDIGAAIQAIRYANNMTQDQVVAQMQLLGLPTSNSSYAKIEPNRMNIKVSELIALSRIFHVDCGAFFSTLKTH